MFLRFEQMLIISVIILCIQIECTFSQDNFDENIRVGKKCRQRNRLIATDKGDLYTVIDATFNEKLILQCHYCQENDDARPKNWYKIDKLGITRAHPVNISMENDSQRNRIQVTAEHSLIIDNFTEKDVGLYYCKSFEDPNIDGKYNYLVDLIADENSTSDIETGNITMWTRYYEDYFLPINKLFSSSEAEEFVLVREELMLKMELITSWDPWRICEVCGRPQGKGIRRKTGYCRIKLTPQLSQLAENVTDNEDFTYLLSASAISCKSRRLSRILPQISNFTKVIPNYVQVQNCEGVCNPDAEGAGSGWKVGKSKGFKYRKTVVLQEGDYLTLICPESTLENTVQWRKGAKKLSPGHSVPSENPQEEPRILVDTFNTLYLANVKTTEEGNFTCQVDDIRMQQVRVFVAAKSRLLTNLFLRHFMYLGFVLSLTLTCYCAGVIISCHRRTTFKSYREILKEVRRKNKIDPLEFENLI